MESRPNKKAFVAESAVDGAGRTIGFSSTRLVQERDYSRARPVPRGSLAQARDNNCVRRCRRDVHAISSHVVLNFDVAARNFGRAEFGLGRTRPIRCFKCARLGTAFLEADA